MVTFDFIQFGKDLGTRQLGAQARMALLPLLQSHDKVVLNFNGVNVVSNSFADECIAKLLIEMSLDELKSKTTFEGLNPIAKESVLTAIQRRYIALQSA
ncbi:MAG: STAS-like domain-containing protein [Paludibacteraceae bacterium]|nr:STAS-like domain-containing protein [Paludibacteraceae bacterium]